MDPSNEANKEVAIANREAEKLTTQVASLTISKKNITESSELLARIKETQRNLEAKRKEITQPLNLALKNVNALFKEPGDKLKEAERLIKDALLKYQEKVDKAAQKKIGKIEDAVDSGEMGLAEGMDKLGKVQQGPQSVQTESGSAGFQGRKKLQIIDISQIPQKYFLRERVIEAIRLEVAEDVKQGQPLPPGAEFIIVRNVVVRSAK